MDEKEKSHVVASWRNPDWKYVSSNDHNNDSTKFRERMTERRKQIPVTSHVVVTPTTERKS